MSAAAAFAFQLRCWPGRRWLVAGAAAVLVALATGVPTDLVPTPLFWRRIEATWWDYPVWLATAALAGLVAATYVREGEPAPPGRERLAFAGGLLSFLAVGCPTCNVLVVTAIGAGGATAYFAPVQPVLGVFGLGLLGIALAWRVRGLASCRVER